MDSGRFLVILCGALLIGVAIPAFLVFYLKRDNSAGLVRALRRGAETARDPWKRNQQDLDELARRVEALKQKQNHPTDPRSGDSEHE
jgi:hypothetical protein